MADDGKSGPISAMVEGQGTGVADACVEERAEIIGHSKRDPESVVTHWLWHPPPFRLAATYGRLTAIRSLLYGRVDCSTWGDQSRWREQSMHRWYGRRHRDAEAGTRGHSTDGVWYDFDRGL